MLNKFYVNKHNCNKMFAAVVSFSKTYFFVKPFNLIKNVLSFLWKLFISIVIWIGCVIVSLLLIIGFSILSLPIISYIDKLFYGVSQKRKNTISGAFITRYTQSLSLHSELYHDYLEISPKVKLHYVSIGLCREQPLMLFIHGFPEVGLKKS